MTIFEQIIKEHDQHRGMMIRLADTSGDSKERRDLFAEFKQELIAHANAEEQTLYAALLKNSETQEKSRHSIHEHEQIDSLFEELEEKDMSHSSWLATFDKLQHKIEHHMEEEEGRIFDMAKPLVGELQEKELLELFLIRKDNELKKTA